MPQSAQDKNWVGWALPFSTTDGQLTHVTPYARDCLRYVKFLMSTSGLGATAEAPRSLVSMQGLARQAPQSLEERNRQLLKN